MISHRTPCLFFSPVSFGGLKQRHQGIALALSEAGYDVRFIDPVISGRFFYSKRNSGGNITNITLGLPFRASNYPGIQAILNSLAFRIIETREKGLSEERIFWIGDPVWASLSLKNRKAAVYDRCDLHGSFPGQNRSAWAIYERILMDSCDILIASSSRLFSDLRATGHNCVKLVGNAINPAWKLLRSDMARQFPGKIRILSAGAHYEWVDFDWLKKFSLDPGAELHIAGPGRGKEFRRIIGLNNVIYHGVLSHEDLFRLMNRCHVGVAAFMDIELSRAVDPVKVYEYSACGMPVWATPLPNLDEHPFVTRTLRKEEIPVSDLHEMYSADRLITMTAFDIPDWNTRMESIIEVLRELMKS